MRESLTPINNPYPQIENPNPLFHQHSTPHRNSGETNHDGTREGYHRRVCAKQNRIGREEKIGLNHIHRRKNGNHHHIRYRTKLPTATRTAGRSAWEVLRVASAEVTIYKRNRKHVLF